MQSIPEIAARGFAPAKAIRPAWAAVPVPVGQSVRIAQIAQRFSCKGSFRVLLPRTDGDNDGSPLMRTDARSLTITGGSSRVKQILDDCAACS
jgi:hypothetical protein